VFVATEPTYRKPALRRRARAMRREGRSVRAIAGALGVARSTASLWVRDIPLSDAQRARLEAADPVASRRRTGQLAWSRLTRDSRRRAQVAGRRLASHGDPLHQAGCMLFWAEGSRHRNRVTFTNADSDMVRFFLRFLRECYGVTDAQVGLSINCHLGNGLTLAEIEAWWLERLGLPPTCLRTAAVNRTSSASRGVRRPLLYGTARVVVHSTEIVQSIYGAIQEYAGCSRPEWAELGLEPGGG
jgi:hypothetical protein